MQYVSGGIYFQFIGFYLRCTFSCYSFPANYSLVIVYGGHAELYIFLNSTMGSRGLLVALEALVLDPSLIDSINPQLRCCVVCGY